ncbi:MAG: hypothetical protein ACSHXF_16475 [Aquaticitalea sp.]
MKKVYILIVAVCLSMAYQSCTPQSLSGQETVPKACCGDDGTIYPPPPPPPPPLPGGGGGFTGG